MSPSLDSGSILVVDDEPRNLELMQAYLESAGYQVVSARSGQQAIEAFRRHAIDLVLLDVMMPGMDGFETCRWLREIDGGDDVPIVFCTALDDDASLERAAESRGDDYLVKPVSRTPLLVRVRSLMRVRRLQQERREQNEALRRQRDQLRRLEEQRRETLGYLLHDLNNQMASQIMNAHYLASYGALEGENLEAARALEVSTHTLSRMINNLSDLTRHEHGELDPRFDSLDVGTVASSVVQAYRERAKQSQITLGVTAGGGTAKIQGDREMIERLLVNLVDNALKHSPRGSAIVIRLDADPKGLHIEVCDQGDGVPDDIKDRIFERFVQVGRRGEQRTSRGLGLAFCRLVANVHGGRIWVDDNVPHGSRFRTWLPHTPPNRGQDVRC